MPWGNRKEDDLPESLRGRDPKEVAQALEDAKALKARLDALEAKDAERDTAFQGFGTTQQELVNTLRAVNERIVTPPARSENNDSDRREASSFITDPDVAFAERAAPLAAITMQTAAITAKQEALRAFQRKQSSEKNNIDATLFERFEGEVLEMAKNCTAQQLANPATWAHLFYNVKGRHTDEIVANPQSFFTENATRAVRDETPASDKPTEQEIKLASKMGVPIENYMKHKKEATVNPF